MLLSYLTKALSVVVLALIVVSSAYIFWFVSNSDEIQSKREWSILQDMYNKREYNSSGRKIFIEKYEEYYFARVLSSNDNVSLILLNAKYKPMIKVFPKNDISLSADEFKYILSKGKVNKETESYLDSKIKNGR